MLSLSYMRGLAALYTFTVSVFCLPNPADDTWKLNTFTLNTKTDDSTIIPPSAELDFKLQRHSNGANETCNLRWQFDLAASDYPVTWYACQGTKDLWFRIGKLEGLSNIIDGIEVEIMESSAHQTPAKDSDWDITTKKATIRLTGTANSGNHLACYSYPGSKSCLMLGQNGPAPLVLSADQRVTKIKPVGVVEAFAVPPSLRPAPNQNCTVSLTLRDPNSNAIDPSAGKYGEKGGEATCKGSWDCTSTLDGRGSYLSSKKQLSCDFWRSSEWSVKAIVGGSYSPGAPQTSRLQLSLLHSIHMSSDLAEHSSVAQNSAPSGKSWVSALVNNNIWFDERNDTTAAGGNACGQHGCPMTVSSGGLELRGVNVVACNSGQCGAMALL